jgi:hypothetical protein
MSGVFRNIDPPPPHRVYPPPRLWCGGRTDSLCGEGVGGSIVVRKTPNTALYSIHICKYFVGTAVALSLTFLLWITKTSALIL